MNDKVAFHRVLYVVCGCTLVVLSLGARADTTAPATSTVAATTTADGSGADQVMILGDIKVTGQKVIIAVLQQVKAALNRPIDTSKEHADDIVCRIATDTGSRAREYLTCASNAQLARMRFASQNRYLGAYAQRGSSGTMADPALLLEHIVGQVPSHVLRVPLNKSKFDAMMHSVPDVPPEAAPAAGTASAN